MYVYIYDPYICLIHFPTSEIISAPDLYPKEI